MTTNEWEYLQLDADEAEHNKRIRTRPADETKRYMDLANEGAKLVLNGLAAAEDTPYGNEPKTLVMLLLAKSAQNIRFVRTGLALGYYAGAYGVLRSSLEGLAYAALFDSNPAEIGIWLRNEFSSTSLPGNLSTLRGQQLGKAKEALFNLESHGGGQAVKECVNDFWEESHKRAHPTIRGLAQEFGVDIENFIPDDFEEMFVGAGENFDEALEKYAEKALKDSALFRRFGANVLRQRKTSGQGEGERVIYPLGCKYNDTTVDDVALMAFYVTHRLLDMVKDMLRISDRQFTADYQAWHKEIRGS